MVAPERRIVVKLPSYGEVMEEVKAELLRLVGEKVVEFQEERFRAWFGKPWQREKDARSIIRCPGCSDSPGFERRGRRGRCFHTRYGRVESTLLQVTCKGCDCTFSPFVGFFAAKGKRYSKDLVENLVLSALTVSYHETSRRAEREVDIKAAAITVWRQLKEAYQRYERRGKKASSSRGGVLVADSTGVKTGKTKRGSSLNLAIKVTGREIKGKRARLKKELVSLSVGKWREDELKEARADLVVTDGEPELKGVMARTQPDLPSQRCLFHTSRDLYWALYRDGAQGEQTYWEGKLVGELGKPSAEGMIGVDHLIAELDSRRLHSAATYLRNARDELFTVTKLREQGTAPELVMAATSSVEREFREINRRTEVGARWTDEGVERVARLLEEVRLNGTRRLEF
ncbi:transposase [Dehalococcoidia bacterium]|nr:transposase [Dehalococcoidia bacterium]